MLSKIASGMVLAGILFAVSVPMAAYAAEAPTTKAECKKAKDMKWDRKSKACVKTYAAEKAACKKTKGMKWDKKTNSCNAK
jgi:hypothetical protein